MASRSVSIELHAREWGASEDEIVATLLEGETFATKFNCTGFRRNFGYDELRRGRRYAAKQLEVFAVEESDRWVVILVIAKFFGYYAYCKPEPFRASIFQGVSPCRFSASLGSTMRRRPSPSLRT
jgi:hypothetical protein